MGMLGDSEKVREPPHYYAYALCTCKRFRLCSSAVGEQLKNHGEISDKFCPVVSARGGEFALA
jgi:hypothetical protein